MARANATGATLALISISLSELRKDFAVLLDADWPEPIRRRAHGLATALQEACDRHGLKPVSECVRSLAGLARLSKGEAAPLRDAMKEKVAELLNLAERRMALLSDRSTG